MRNLIKIAIISLCVCTFLFLFNKYQALKNENLVTPNYHQINSGMGIVTPSIRLRKFPYPYKAMLAIASDADHMTLRKFNLIHEFLNTTDMTPLGKGLGLDISDSFFMYNGSDIKTDTDFQHTPLSKEFTYFRGVSTERYGADVMDTYIHAGWIDSFHTYGDFSMTDQKKTRFKRQLAIQAIQALKASHDNITVWIDHGNESNVDNFGSFGINLFYNYQQGANPSSPYYHTDLLIPYGIKFVWSDHSSEVFGHDSMIYPIKLPDGRRVWGFWRYTSSPELQRNKTHWVWNIYFLDKQLEPKNLQGLVQHHQYAILAQHFDADNHVIPLPKNAINSLDLLANEYHSGNILVARTSRLLQYNVTEQYLHYTVTQLNGRNVIHITTIDDPVFGSYVPSIADLSGVTFYTPNPDVTEIEIGNKPVDKNWLFATYHDFLNRFKKSGQGLLSIRLTGSA